MNHPTRWLPTLPPCSKEGQCLQCRVEDCAHTHMIHIAVRLIQGGAKTALVYQITNLPKKFVKRLYWQLTGHPSSGGMSPVTDAWFLKDERRMLQAAVAWQLHKQVAKPDLNEAQTLLDVYELYLFHVREPLLNLTRIVTLFQLLSIGIWRELLCPYCHCIFLAPSDDDKRDTCPGCKLYFRFRCRDCSAALPLKTSALGRPRSLCQHCSQTSTVVSKQNV